MQSLTVDRILSILCSVLDAYSTVLFLQDSASAPAGEYTVSSAFSLGNRINRTVAIQEGKGLVGWILRNKEPLLVSNFDQRQHNLGYYHEGEEQTIKAFMGCALPHGAGALCVDSKRQYSFSEKDQKLLHLFADLLAHVQAGQVQQESFQRVQQYYTALQAIYALRRKHSRWADFLRHFLDLMASITGFAYCTLCTRDPDGESFSVEGENTTLLSRPGSPPPSFPMSHGVVGWVFRNSTPVMTAGLDGAPEALLVGRGGNIPHFQSVIATPLVIQRKTRGVLCLAHDTPLELDNATKDFVSMVSEHLALFLENLYVKCRLRDLHCQYHTGAKPIAT